MTLVMSRPGGPARKDSRTAVPSSKARTENFSSSSSLVRKSRKGRGGSAIQAVRARAEMRRENEWLRTLVRALAELCLEKGLITEQELKDRIAKIDADDAARAKAERAAARVRRTRRR